MRDKRRVRVESSQSYYLMEMDGSDHHHTYYLGEFFRYKLSVFLSASTTTNSSRNIMGSMNNNWLSFPLSPVHDHESSLSHSHELNHFSLGLPSNDHNMDHPFQNSEWNLINSHGGDNNSIENIPKVADFLGVERSETNQIASALLFNQIQPSGMTTHGTDYGGVPDQQNTTTLSDDTSKEFDSQASSGGNLQSLALSMGPGKASINAESSATASNTITTVEETPRKTLDSFGQRTSIYRGVTKHRWTGRYEAHLWDNSCRREGQSRKGRQVYLGGYDREEKAARAYDLAALKYWGTSTTTNFPISIYERELEDMKHMTRQEFVASLRRKSSGFSRGASMYRGVTRHHQHGRWQARIGRVAGNKDLYLGTFSTEEEAAEAYDIAAIKFRGLNAVTNFDMNRYDVKSILESNTLPIGGASKRLKETQDTEAARKREEMKALANSSFYDHSNSGIVYQGYPMMPPPFEQPQPLLALQPTPHGYQYTTQDPAAQNYLQMHQQLQTNPYSFQNHPTNLLQGLMTLGSSSSSSTNGYDEASSYYNTGMTMVPTSTTVNGGGGGGLGTMTDLGLVRGDYDMSSAGSYGGWVADSVNGTNVGGFTMWNDN